MLNSRTATAKMPDDRSHFIVYPSFGFDFFTHPLINYDFDAQIIALWGVRRKV
jgi:hypothetical protein